MKKINFLLITTLLLVVLFGRGPTTAFAATSPLLGSAVNYGVLSGTYTNTSAGTTINGSVGFSTGPAVLPAGLHANYGSGAPYATAGANQGAALTSLNSQACTFTFASGAIDLATDTTHGLLGIYTPGVYCIDGAASIGTAGITLSGSGTYIFRMTGALTTVANSIVLLDGSSACDIWWTPGAATTLGADSTFIGTNIDAAGITLGNNVNWTGRALAFGGTVTTVLSDTITVPTCTTPSATLTLVKTVINNNDGTKSISDFPLFIGATAVTSGAAVTLSPGDYSVSETNVTGYTASVWGGDCSAAGNITLLDGDTKICTITNDDNPTPVSSGGGSSPVVVRVPPIISITKIPSPLTLPNGPGLVTYTYSVSNIGTVYMRDIKVTDDKCLNPVFISGDNNGNSLLETDEIWTFRCASQINQTTKNIATVIGYDYGGLSATDVTSATVVVGQSLVPPLIRVVKVPTPLSLPAKGGLVKYAYTVTNAGTVALSNIRIADDKCQPVIFQSGDVNINSLLDVNEAWLYNCQMNITNNTVNTVTVQGSANGLTALDYAIATVLVSDSVVTTPVVPKLPNTGLGEEGTSNNLWYVFIAIGIVSSLSLFYVTSRKRSN